MCLTLFCFSKWKVAETAKTLPPCAKFNNADEAVMFLNPGEATPHRQRANLRRNRPRGRDRDQCSGAGPSLKQGEREVSAQSGARIRLRQPPPASAPVE